jgi:hypothetical protein
MTERNYGEEAAKIALGETDVIPEKAHVVALVQQMASVQRNLKLTNTLIAALMVDNDYPVMFFPKKLLDAVERRFVALEFSREDDGSVKVTRRVMPTGSATVN